MLEAGEPRKRKENLWIEVVMVVQKWMISCDVRCISANEATWVGFVSFNIFSNHQVEEYIFINFKHPKHLKQIPQCELFPKELGRLL